MTIAYRSGNTAGNATGTNLTVTAPTGIANDDILIAVLYREGGAWTPPAGWTQVGADIADSGANMTLAAYYKRAASESGNYTFNLSSSVWRIAAMACYSGCITSGSPIDVSATKNDTLNPVLAATITTTNANEMCVVGMGNYDSTDITVGTSGYTQRDQLGGCEWWEILQASAGASGAKTFSSNTSAHWATIHLALLPAVAGGASIPRAAIIVTPQPIAFMEI